MTIPFALFPTARDAQGETRPRDFATRLPRRARAVGVVARAPRRRWTAGVLALAAVALPAFATPGSWDRFVIADAVAGNEAVSPMPFETAGGSFPGSAFYYLDTEERPLRIGEGIRSDADDSHKGPGAAARPLVIDNSGVDRSRALQCLAAAIYYEAASEADAGQRAVAQVVLNRVAHPAYPNTVCGVVYQGSERNTGCQFSFTCDGSLARRPVALFWDRAMSVARAALGGYVYAPAGLATHYHTVQVNPYWAPSLNYLGTIGAHRFYSFRGGAGNPATFRYAYFGGEPVAARHRPDDAAARAQAAAVADPLAVQRSFGVTAANGTVSPTAATYGSTPAEAAAVATPAPAYTAPLRDRGGDSLYRAKNLPESNGIRPEYANSGRWISQPGT